jgi:DNA-binding beta-propeller fold protein YncE
VSNSLVRFARPFVVTLLAGCAAASAGSRPAGPGAENVYDAYVVSESADKVARIRFGPDGARVERDRPVGTMPVELDGPHGVAVSPDGRHYYVTIGHGTPFGSLWKLSAEDDSVEGRTMLGLFPATVDVTPDGEYAFVSNFNLHGDPVPSSISKVHLPSMTEVARTETCVMPHGSRINAHGTKQYSVCMMDDLLVEIDVASGQVSRRFSLAPGREGPAAGSAPAGRGASRIPADAHAGHGAMNRETAGVSKACSPTWAHPGIDGSRVYVACNKTAEILEIDTQGWTITRRFSTGDNPYNLDVTPDGRYLLVTLKNRNAPATEIFDLTTGQNVARVPNSGMLPHGVAVTHDSRFAFVSVEGVGAAPGKVDVVDLASFQRVATVDVGQQAGGIAVVPRP